MKCACCKKKTVMEFKCSCGFVYCIACRLPEVHKCAAPKEEKVVLVKVVADKVEKI
jgi:predicted nucleic acid binding AN1-type Zn finger protein